MLMKPMLPPSVLREDLPKWVDVVLGRALAKSARDRYESMTAFAKSVVMMEGRYLPVIPLGNRS